MTPSKLRYNVHWFIGTEILLSEFIGATFLHEQSPISIHSSLLTIKSRTFSYLYIDYYLFISLAISLQMLATTKSNFLFFWKEIKNSRLLVLFWTFVKPILMTFLNWSIFIIRCANKPQPIFSYRFRKGDLTTRLAMPLIRIPRRNLKNCLSFLAIAFLYFVHNMMVKYWSCTSTNVRHT